MKAMTDAAFFALAVAAMWLLMALFVDAYDLECQVREEKAREVVSYGVVR